MYIPFNWTTSSTPLPFAFDSTAIGSDGNNIWFIGGEDTSFRALNTIYKFNLLNQSFNEPPLIIQSKVEISGQSFVELDNVIYFVHNAPSSDSLFIHALDMDTYTTSSYTAIDKLPSDPEFIFSSPCLAAYPNKVFVIGGGCGSICSNYATHILTLNTMDWTLGPDLNERRAAHSCSISNGKIYAIGGTGLVISKLHFVVEIY